VPQALVTMDGATVVTDQAGQFDLAAPSTCVRATVVARGYLDMIGLRARAGPLWWPDTEF
jgi:hypothetical protein